MSSHSVEPADIRLEERISRSVRLSVAVAIACLLVWEVTSFRLYGQSIFAQSAGALWSVLVVGTVLLCVALFKSNLRWTIRGSEIEIDRDWVSGVRQTEFVRSSDIADIRVERQPDESGDRYTILIKLESGRDIESPPVTTSDRAHEIMIEIMKRLEPSNEAARSDRL